MYGKFNFLISLKNWCRSQVETPINENSKKDVKKIQIQDKNEYEEPSGYVLFKNSINIYFYYLRIILIFKHFIFI